MLFRSQKLDMIPLVRRLLADPDAAVLRESAIALRYNKAPEAAELWAGLARRYQGDDRWYLEALGIAARGRENALYARLKGDPHVLQFAWEFRPSDALPYLISHLRDSTAVVDALAVMPQPAAGVASLPVLLSMSVTGAARLLETLKSQPSFQSFCL